MPSSASSTSPQTFHLFSNLALELRLKIWSHACFPRTLTLQYAPNTDTLTSSSPPPALLSASHEARTEALRTYKLCFGTASKPAQIYFNPYRDILYIPRCREMGYDETLRDFRELAKNEERKFLDEIRRVAIDHVDIDVKRPWESYNKASFIRSFPNLSEVILIVTSSKRQEPGLFNEWSHGEIDVGKEVDLVHPKLEPELLLRWWESFRRSFVSEERLLEDVCKVMGREYKAFVLPALRIMSNVSKRKEVI